MSCADCTREKNERHYMMNIMDDAAMAHGFELWQRQDGSRLTVLAVPTAASHGSVDDLVDHVHRLAERRLIDQPALRRSPRRPVEAVPPIHRVRNEEAGHRSFRVNSSPPFELVFIDKLMA